MNANIMNVQRPFRVTLDHSIVGKKLGLVHFVEYIFRFSLIHRRTNINSLLEQE